MLNLLRRLSGSLEGITGVNQSPPRVTTMNSLGFALFTALSWSASQWSKKLGVGPSVWGFDLWHNARLTFGYIYQLMLFYMATMQETTVP